ncbi:MAG: hypothetical protein ABSD59_13975 [Terracidiphilus sp.]
MTFPFRYMLALCLCLPSAAVAQQPEPESPGIHETIAYINANTEYGVSLTGTMLTANNERWERRLDLLNAAALSATSGDDTSAVALSCNGMMKCIHSAFKGQTEANGIKPDDEDVVTMDIKCKNATVAPHVAKAINHLVRLVQQQVAGSQPF